MTLTTPAPGVTVDDNWVDGLTKVANGFYRSIQVESAYPLSYAVTTAAVDIAGVTTTFSVLGSNAYALVWYGIDASATVTAAGNLLQVWLVVDGGALSNNAQLLHEDRVARATPMRCRRVALAAGSHTLKMQIAKGGGTFTLNGGHMQIELFDLV